MKIPISITVNGVTHNKEVEARMLLSQFLREELSLTGTHIGCDTSSCGACTVHLDGKALKSCSMLVAQANGRAVTTIEGMATNGQLHPLQEGFHQEHGLQCGFCTPGMIMTAADLLKRNSDPTEKEIRESLEGNFCRCTGYHNIVKSIQHAAKSMKSVS